MNASPTNPKDPASFEEAIAKLEEVVRLLENGETTLEESLANYEQGVSLLRYCYGVLRQAEQKVALLAEEDAQGKPVAKPFVPASTTDEPRRRSAKSSDPGF